MPKLLDVVNDARLSEKQKAFIWKRVHEYSPKGKPKLDIAKDCLSNLWQIYDSGGISVGRSLRAAILEEAHSLIEAGLFQAAKTLLAILVAMYYSPEYINKNGWFDFVVCIEDLPLLDRTYLVPAVPALGVDEIPDISLCTLEHIKALLDDGKDTRRNIQKGS